MSQAILGLGASFRRWDGGDYVHISEIINIAGPAKSRDTPEVTTLDSSDGYREFMSGLRDGGTVTFTMIFRRDTYNIIDADFESNDLQNYEIYLSQDPEETSFEFEGFVTEVPLTVAAGDPITVDVSIKLSGSITVNSGSGSSA